LAELLPVQYFHVVFTLPEELASLALQNQRLVYNLLFSSAAATLRTLAADPKHLGAEIGFLAVLHTWGQTLRHHPHLHCLVPGGGLTADDKHWISCRQRFFLPVRVLARFFRRAFLAGLAQAFAHGKLGFHGSSAYFAAPRAFASLLTTVRAREWHVYAKPPFAGPQQVLSYLGRYTHRVAISNHRLLALKDGQVSFIAKDYARGQQQRPISLSTDEFMRRFLLHVLPRGFQRLRHFGFLANRRRGKLARCRQLLGAVATPSDTNPLPRDYQSLYETVTGESLQLCPACQRGTMKLTAYLSPLVAGVKPPPQLTVSVEVLDSS
jgi:hypothetical protein